MKDFAEDQGNANIRGSKDATRYAAQVKLIEDGHLWMQMIPNRNLTADTYNEETADMILAEILGSYAVAFELFEKKILELKNGE